MNIEDVINIEEIKKLKNLYSYYWDGGEVDKLIELFADDGTCEFGAKYGNWTGKEAVAAGFRGLWEGHVANGRLPFQVIHTFANPVIDITGPDTATGRWFLMEFTTIEGESNPPRNFGIYQDDYRKVDGEWKFVRTSVDLLWPNRDVKSERASY